MKNMSGYFDDREEYNIYYHYLLLCEKIEVEFVPLSPTEFYNQLKKNMDSIWDVQQKE